jgi:S1/P1 Nuclease
MEIETFNAIGDRIILLLLLLVPVRAWGRGNDGHRIVAVVAADNLTPAAHSHVASILHAPANHTTIAMEAASIRSDSEFREEDSSTKPRHFIDICLEDRRGDVPAATASQAKLTNMRDG